MFWKSKSLTVILPIICLMSAASYSEAGVQIPSSLGMSATEPGFDSNRLQSNIHSGRNLGAVAKEKSLAGDKTTSFGFAAKSDEARFFLIGAMYSEALACVRGDKLDLAAQRLESIEKEFITLKVPQPLYSYLTKTENLVKTGKYGKNALVDFLSLFQPFFEEYAKSQSADKLALFRTGSWLQDMSISAAAGDRTMLKQTATINYLLKEMKRMDAPKGSIDALNEIGAISGSKEVSDADADKVQKLVKKIRELLA